MNINFTMIIQIIVFFGVILFTMKYIWPAIMGAIEEREKQIADGLAASDKAAKALAEAEAEATKMLKEAREQASQIRDQAHQQAIKIKDQAKSEALAEKERQLEAARAEIELEAARAKDTLRKQVSSLALVGAEKLLQREVDEKTHADLLDELVKEI